MTVDEFRQQRVQNTRLAWLIHGHKIKVEELENFKSEELKQIYFVSDKWQVKKKIEAVLERRNVTIESPG